MIFKHHKDNHRFFLMHPQTQLIAVDMYLYCYKRDIPYVITSTLSTELEDQKLKRRSSTHRTGRAFDLRSNHWDASFISEFMQYFEDKYKDVAAFSRSRGERALCIYHDNHIHVQVDPEFSVRNLLEEP